MNQSNQDLKSPRALLNPYPILYLAFPQYLGAFTALPDVESNYSGLVSCMWVGVSNKFISFPRAVITSSV